MKNYTIEEVKVIVEVGVIPAMYLHHLFDSEMSQIYYFWNGLYYRLQTRLVNCSCIALLPAEGCTLGDYRPLICKVWPFWWKSGSNPSTSNFQIEINGDCTMATRWNMPANQILREFGYSENTLKRDLLVLSKALKEHGRILREAGEKRISPEKLLDWILDRISFRR